MVKPKPAPIIHTERLLALVPYISAHQGISLKDLAGEFGVTTKQMNDDLTTLWMCGLPGYTALELMDLSFESGYVSIRNAPTLQMPRTLSLEEVVALLLGLDLLKDSVTNNHDVSERINALSQRLKVRSGITSNFQATSPVSSVLRAQILAAIDNHQQLRISYHSLYSDNVTERVVNPLEVRIDAGVEYLIAYCHHAGAFRTFRVDRIQRCELVHLQTDHPPTLVATDERALNAVLTLSSRLRLMKERFSLQQVAIGDQINVASFSRAWLLRSIFAASGSAQLQKPMDLRAEIAQKAQLILDRYR